MMTEEIDNTRWEAALVPVGITGETYTFDWKRTILMDSENSAEERKRCYDSLLAIRDRERPRGGIAAAALAEIADGQGMTVEALTRSLTRDNERQRGKLPRKRPRD
jgi:hypothetical protein